MIEQVVAATSRKHQRLPPAFVVELLQWLRDQPSTAAPAWQALHRALEAQGDSPEEMLRRRAPARGGEPARDRQRDHQHAAGVVDRLAGLLRSGQRGRADSARRIRSAPTRAMDFPTRDRYRHSVEQLARGRETVGDRRRRAGGRARAGGAPAPIRSNDRRHHVGYYLISRGRFRLEQDLGYPPAVGERLARFLFGHPAIGYLGAIAAVELGVLSSLLAYANRHGAAWPELLLVALVALMPVSELAISLLNLMLTSQCRRGSCRSSTCAAASRQSDRTMVVVPAIIDSEAQRRAPCSTISRCGSWPIATRTSTSRCSATSATRAAADHARTTSRCSRPRGAAIDASTTRHGADRFFLFHRERRWNADEQRWMGWERKRGKLARVQPAAARRHRHQLRRPARRSVGAARRSAT